MSDNLGIENSMHLQWQSKLEAMGYPQQTARNVAVSNGSECGITQPFAPGDNLFDVNGNASPSLLTSTIANMIPGLTTLTTFSSAALLNNPAPLIGLLPGGRTTFDADFWGNAQPLNTAETLYKGRLTLRKRILFVININASLTNKSANSNSSILPFDYYHGGEYGLPSINIGGISGALGSVRQSGSGETVEISIPRGGCSSQNFNIGVRAFTQCGVSAIYSKSYANPCYNSFREENRVVYPNPAKDQITIDLSQASSHRANVKPFRVVIANQMGETMKQLSTHSSKPTIDVFDLKSGTYFIVIYTDDEVVRKTLLIE